MTVLAMKSGAMIVVASLGVSQVADALNIDAANVSVTFAGTQDSYKTTGCGFQLSVFDPVSSEQLLHTFMIGERMYQATTAATYVDVQSHMNGGGNTKDQPLKVYAAWLLENTVVKADTVDVNKPLSVLTYNVKSYFDGKAISTTTGQYSSYFTDNRGVLIQQSTDLKVFYAELFLVLSGNFQFVFIADPEKVSTTFAINVPPNRAVYDQIRQCVAGTKWFKTAAAFGNE